MTAKYIVLNYFWSTVAPPHAHLTSGQSKLLLYAFDEIIILYIMVSLLEYLKSTIVNSSYFTYRLLPVMQFIHSF